MAGLELRRVKVNLAVTPREAAALKGIKRVRGYEYFAQVLEELSLNQAMVEYDRIRQVMAEEAKAEAEATEALTPVP